MKDTAGHGAEAGAEAERETRIKTECETGVKAERETRSKAADKTYAAGRREKAAGYGRPE